MKTNRFFLGFLAVATMFTACSKDEAGEMLQSEKGISFGLQGGMPSLKANSTTKANVDAFVVYGNDNANAGTKMLFENVTAALDLGRSSYAYSPLRYYNKGADNARFFAFSPVTAKPAKVKPTADFMTTATGAEMLSFEYTVPKPLNDGKTSQIDLLVASVNVTPSASAVTLSFQHALARIFVSANNSAVNPVIISSLTLKNLHETGRFALATGASIPNNLEWNWTTIGVKTNYAYVLAEAGVVVPDKNNGGLLPKRITSMEQGMMVMPQVTQNDGDDETPKAGDFYLEVEYNIVGSTPGVAQFLLEDGFEFEAGKQYTIQLHFSGTEVKFDIEVADFEDLEDVPAYY